MAAEGLPTQPDDQARSPVPGRRVALVSDRADPGYPLEDAFDVTQMSFDAVEAELSMGTFDVVVVDASEQVRFAAVSQIALGGTRGVVVVGPPSDATEAMRYLDLGAADYVSSQAAPAEFTARVRAVARSMAQESASDEVLTIGDVSISLLRREVRRRGERVHLTPNEFAVLEVLAREAGELVSHRDLTVRVWGPEFADSRHYLRLYIRQLREKLEHDPASPQVLLTEWGRGYRLALDPTRWSALRSRRASA